MDNLDDIRLRAEPIGPLSAHINNYTSRAGIRWNTLEQFDSNIKYMNGIHSAINDGWKNIITSSGCNNRFNLPFKPLERFASVPFTGDYTNVNPDENTIPTDPNGGLYGIDGPAYLKTNDNDNIPEDQRYTATYKTYDTAIDDKHVYIPRAASQFLPSHGHPRIHMETNPWHDLHGDLHGEHYPITWENSACEKLGAGSFVYHSYPSIEYLLADYIIKDTGIRKVYEYKGVDEITITEKDGRNISIIFYTDIQNTDINVLLKFASDIQLGESFNITVHYLSSKMANTPGMSMYEWPKLIICDQDVKLFATGSVVNGMYQYITSYGDIQGTYSVAHGSGQHSYVAMLGSTSCMDIDGVYGCIGRHPLLENDTMPTVTNMWCEYDNQNTFTDVVSYYIKVIKAVRGVIPVSIVQSCNGGRGMVNNA